MRWRRSFHPILLTLSLTAPALPAIGCGGADDSDDETSSSGESGGSESGGSGTSSSGAPSVAGRNCAISGRLSGAIEHYLPSAELGCGYSAGFNDDADTTYVGLDGPVASVYLQIADVGPGVTGTFPAAISVRRASDDKDFSTLECSVDITENEATGPMEQLGVPHQLRGVGSCDDDLVTNDDSGELLRVDPFAFATPAEWSE